MVKTRENLSFFLIGVANPETLEKLPKLPTVREVLQRMLFLLADIKRVDIVSNLTTDELIATWARTRIPLRDKRNIVALMQKLHQTWKLCKKNPSKDLDRKKKFEERLDTLFDVSKTNDDPKDTQAKEFLEDQRTKREFCLAAMDGPGTRLAEHGGTRRAARSVPDESESVEESDNDTGETEPDVADPDFVHVPKRAKKDPPKKNDADSQRDVLTEHVLCALDRNKISDRQAFKIISPVVVALGGDPSKMALSRSTIKRRREEGRTVVCERAMANFDPQGPLVVHWDGTKLENVSNSAHSERLPVLVSWDLEEKLLGAPAVSHPTGEQEAKVVYDLLEEWKCTQKVSAMCFDTPSVNTGKFKGACVYLEKFVGRDLLWLACRHHTHELVLAKAFTLCFGPSTSPEIPLFKRFRENWDNIPKETMKGLAVTKKGLALKQSVISFLVGLTHFIRDDYKELRDLTLTVLGAKPATFSWKKPGPIHHARWMAKVIYAIKIYLLRGQGSVFALKPDEVKQLKRFVRFSTLLYVKPWFQAPLGADAAVHDIEFWNNLHDYRLTDAEISTETITVLERHLWYLSDELVGLAVFSEKVTTIEKQEIVDAMLTKPEGNRSVVGDAVFLRSGRRSLADYATKRSGKIFDKLAIDFSFSNEAPSEWTENPLYIAGQSRVRSLKVVNDLAERGVKLCEDYNKIYTKNDEENQKVLQVVEHNRKIIKTDCTKTALLASLN